MNIEEQINEIIAEFRRNTLLTDYHYIKRDCLWSFRGNKYQDHYLSDSMARGLERQIEELETKLTNLLTQQREEAVEGFVKYCNSYGTPQSSSPISITQLAETYLQSLDGGKGE